MSKSEYTPSTEEVREQYWAASGDPRRDSEAWGEFDRWLLSINQVAWQRGFHDGCDLHST